MSAPPTKAVILVGGPSRGTRFRPLSLNCPKPLFPIAGKPLLYHHLDAIADKQLGIREVYLVGFFEDNVFSTFLERASQDFPSLSIRYLREYQALGTAGGLYHFRDEILRGNPKYLFVIHADICSSFPLKEMRDFQDQHGGLCTMLSTRVTKEQSSRYGCAVVDPSTAEVLHYVEKPEFFISDLINGGIYLFDASIFGEMEALRRTAEAEAASDISQSSYLGSNESLAGTQGKLRLEQDVLRQLAGSKRLWAYETTEFWSQLKSATSSVRANSLMLGHLKKTHPDQLAPESTANKDASRPQITGPVYIHPSAQVHATAKIGPHVSIGPRAVIGPGVRIRDSIILDAVEIKANACVLHSVIGWSSKIGSWTRIEGTPGEGAQSGKLMVGGQKNPAATVLGQEVSVRDELIIRNCIVLPHKDLSSSYQNDILM
ncbi:hypothetical protein RI367_001661 [Sorochytrium milnesiophthora]